MKDELEVRLGDEVLLGSSHACGTVVQIDGLGYHPLYHVKRFDGVQGSGVGGPYIAGTVRLHRRKGAKFAIGDVVERKAGSGPRAGVNMHQHCEVVGYTPHGNVNLRRLRDGHYSWGHAELSLQIVAAKSTGPAPVPAPVVAIPTVRQAPEDIHYFSEGEFSRTRGIHLEVNRAEYMSFLQERESGIELLMQNPYHDKEVCMRISTEAAKQLASDIMALALSIERGEV